MKRARHKTRCSFVDYSLISFKDFLMISMTASLCSGISISYFENGNMSEAEMDTYLSLLDNMMEELDGMPKKAPDLLVYLQGPLDIHLERIKKRGREYEQVDENEENDELLAYYKHLHSRYDDWYNNYDKSKKIAIPITK